MSCGCSNDGSQNPPGSTPSASTLPGGAQSAFAGTATIPLARCGPPPCPQPPVSNSITREPYAPSWVATLTSNWFGQLLLKVGNTLVTLASKCTGVVWFDASSQTVSVQNPPFASSVPRQTAYGYIGMVVSTIRKICNDGDDSGNCAQEVHQEFAAQVPDVVECGKIMLWNEPNCGDVPLAQSTDVANQGRWDEAKLPELDDVDASCSKGEIRIFAFLPWKKQLGSGKTQDCVMPVKMRRLRMGGDQWGTLLKTDPLAATSNILVAKRVGGTDAAPCLELSMTDISLAAVATAIAEAAAARPLVFGVSADVLIWNAAVSGLSAIGALNLGVVPVGSRGILINLRTLLESNDGSNADFVIFCNGIRVMDGGKNDNTTSYQVPDSQQCWVPCINGNLLNFAGSSGGPPGATPVLKLTVTVQGYM